MKNSLKYFLPRLGMTLGCLIVAGAILLGPTFQIINLSDVQTFCAAVVGLGIGLASFVVGKWLDVWQEADDDDPNNDPRVWM